MFPADIKWSEVLYFDILGAPIGDDIFCANCIASKGLEAETLFSKLEEVGTNPHTSTWPATRVIPASLALNALQLFDADV